MFLIIGLRAAFMAFSESDVHFARKYLLILSYTDKKGKQAS
jgi:hypothetical protein